MDTRKFKTAEEAVEYATSIQDKHVALPFTNSNGEHVVTSIPRAQYKAPDGSIQTEEVWADRYGSLTNIGDMTLTEAHTLLRTLIRQQREMFVAQEEGLQYATFDERKYHVDASEMILDDAPAPPGTILQ